MNIITTNGDFFKNIILCIKDFTDLVNIEYNEDGLIINTTDNMHTSMLYLKINKILFDKKYDIKKSGVFGINLNKFNDVLKTSSKNCIIELIKKEDDEDINIKLINDNKKINFKLKLLNIISDNYNSMNINYNYQIKMSSEEFEKTIKKVSSFGSDCYIYTDQENIYIDVSGDIGYGSFSINDIVHEIDYKNEENKNKYSLSYLLKICKSSKISENIIINLNKNLPLKVTFNHEYANITYYLAPKVDDDDNDENNTNDENNIEENNIDSDIE